MSVDDKRRTTRVPISLAVQFQLGDGMVRSGVIENISTDGLLLVATDPITANAQLRMMFEDHKTEQSLEVTGRVVRAAAAGAFGVAFISLNNEALGFVRTLVERQSEAGSTS